MSTMLTGSMPHTRRIAERSPLPTVQRSSRTGSASATIQRKSACACGGGCPRCTSGSDLHDTAKVKMLQKKLSIGASNDPLEEEADRVADQVLASSAGTEISNSSPRIQRFSAAESAETSAAPTSVGNVLKSNGSEIEPALQHDMSRRFGQDFSNVRLHSGKTAEQSAREVNAKAYTVGNDIVFGAGQYSPNSHSGRRLLAHELTHVVQQQRGGSRVLARTPADDEAAVYKAMMEMPQWQRDEMARNGEAMRNRVFPSPSPAPTQQPMPVQDVGCHKDPYAKAGSNGACASGRKKADDTIRTSQKAIQQPEPDFTLINKKNRARLDRLNEAYFEWRRSGKYIYPNQFSPYEIEKDLLFPVEDRWDLSMQAHGVDPNNLEAVKFDAYYFSSESEYKVELYDRKSKYKKAFKKCDEEKGLKWPKLHRTQPDYITCQNRVDTEYYPREAAWQDAQRRAVYADMQVGMPAVTENGFIASLGFHVAHEWLGWDTNRSAALSGALSTLGGLTNAKIQQTISNRNANQNVVPPQAMSIPSQNVGSPPDKSPMATPGNAPQVSIPTLSQPPVITMPRQIDLSQKLQVPSAIPVKTPSNSTPASPPTKLPDGPMRAPPGGGPRSGMTATGSTLTPHKPSSPVITVLPRSSNPIGDSEPPEPGHYIRRKPPDFATQPQILALAGRVTDGRLRDANTGRALNEGEAVFGHGPYYQFAPMRAMAEALGWTQEQFDRFFQDPAKWQIEYGPSNSSRVFDRVPRQRPIH